MHVLLSPSVIRTPVANLLLRVLPVRNTINMARPVAHSINFNSKHLRKGDPLPPFNGKLRVYNMRYCPYAQRTLLALIAKNIDFEVVNINLIDKPEWLTQKSPLGKVPALEISDGECLIESLITAEYVDEAYPQRPLLPKDPVQKAKDKGLIERTGAIHTFLIKILRSPETITTDVVNGYYNTLALLESELTMRGTLFLGGVQPGFIDYMIWPWLERIPSVVEIDTRIAIDNKRYPKLNEYIKRMENDSVVKQYIIPLDVYRKFFNNYVKGVYEYEYLNIKE
ncbi:unnamed protein product [Leptidea sinapis]|uniref:Glutathione S-transferase omega class 1 n=3 Tax=Leptidea sinapis TaxID=189913 RepID=A0A5E4QXQ9_9NEOP|nr:unnamed protein product [Leptidea sinapis]